MRIGIISNSDNLLPLAYTLAIQQLQVYIFYSASADVYVNQKVTDFIKQVNLSYKEEKKGEDLYQWLLQNNFDACFILGYNKLIELNRLKNCPTPIFNVHFGPLPGFKGPVPVFWQLKKGVDKIGLSIHRLSAKFDDGPVVWVKETDNLQHYNYQTVNQALSQLCIEGAFYILQFINNKLPLPIAVNGNNVTGYQKKPGLNDVLINWQTMGAAEICNLVRACNPWNKGALSFFKGQEVKLMDAIVVDNTCSNGSLTPGTIIRNELSLHICCTDAKRINVNMLFFNYCFVPGYQIKLYGFMEGEKFG